jgi:predicted HTH domain antitoxin
MSLSLTIPNEVLNALKIPQQRLQIELTQEIGFMLYQRGLASMGVARRYANLSKREFLQGLAQRSIERHYTEIELTEDIAYAKNCE